MKKLFALLLCVIMVASVFVGCTPEDEDEFDLTSRIGKEAPEGYSLTIGVPTEALVKDYENNALTKWLEEQSGYDIRIIKYQTSPGDYKAQVSTQFNVPGQKMPDILLGLNLGHESMTDYGKEGKLLNLYQYYKDEKYSGEWWDHLNSIDDPEFIEYVEKKLFIEGEEIYYFPTIERNEYDMVRHSAFINQEWLDNLGLPMPTNKEEFYNTLVAFKNQDPNRNGQNDEIPLYAATDMYGDPIGWILNMFGYFDENRCWTVDENGEFTGIYTSDEYREGLIFLNRLIKEGLIPETIFTVDRAEISNLVNPANGQPYRIGIWLGHPTLVLTEGSEAVYKYKAMPQWGYSVLNTPVYTAATCITRDCEYPDAAWEVLMLLSSEEGAYRMRYGEKGVDWVDAAPGTKAFTGLDAEINVLNQSAYGGRTTTTWNLVAGTMGLANENERTELSDNLSAWNKAKLTLMGECYKYNWDRFEEQGGRPANTVMPLVFTAEEEEEQAPYRSNAKDWYKSHRADFAKGIKDPNDDAQWKAYIDGFKDKNYYDWMEICKYVYEYTYGDKAGK